MSTDAEPKPKGGAIGALIQRLRALLSRLKWHVTMPPMGSWRNRVMGLSRARMIWLGGALLFILAGLGLAFFGGSGTSSSSRESVAVALPPPQTVTKAAILSPAPDQGLIEDSPDGPLPVIGKDGRQSWKVYARPFDANDKRPRVALLVTGLGLDRALSQSAMDRLPGVVTLGFDPYADAIKDVMMLARDLGHEALIGLPLEPLDYPRQDPGPLTLLTSLDETQNAARLNKLMGETSGYVGMVALFGSRFVGEKNNLLPVMQNLRQRGLMFVDNKSLDDNSGTAAAAKDMKLPWAGGNRIIDSEADPAAIDKALTDLEDIARKGGAALGIAVLSPALLDRAAAWAMTLDGKSLALSPVSAIANRQTPMPPPPAPPAAAAAPGGAPAAASHEKPAAASHEKPAH